MFWGLIFTSESLTEIFGIWLPAWSGFGIIGSTIVHQAWAWLRSGEEDNMLEMARKPGFFDIEKGGTEHVEAN